MILNSTSPNDLFRHHHLDEFLIVDLTITINICLTNHLINFFIRQLLSEVGHHVTQLCSTDEAVTITVKHFESLNQLLLSVCVLHLSCHQRQELWEINGAVTISIHLIDHVLKLCFGWVLSKRSHHCSQFLRGDGTVTILIEQGEGLLELGNLFLGQLVSHDEWKMCSTQKCGIST